MNATTTQSAQKTSTNTTQEPLNCINASIEELMNAIRTKRPISGITHLITHPGTHSDEFLNWYMQKCTPEGQKAFPGIEDATCDFWTQEELANYQGEECFYRALQKGCFISGTAGGPFDEHGDRKTQKSCAQLMSDYLGLMTTTEGRIIYSNFLEYVNYEDRHGNNMRSQFKNPDFARIIAPALFADNIKKGWRLVNAGLKTEDDLIADAMGFIENEIGAQRLFVKTIAEYQGLNKQIIHLPNLKKEGDNKKPALLIIHSDNDDMPAVAKNQFSKNPDYRLKVLVKINSQGQFYICPMNGTTLTNVIVFMRIAIRRNRKLGPLANTILKSEGTIEGVEEVYYHADSDSIMNGSLTQKDVPGILNKESGISKAELIKVITDGAKNLQSANPTNK